jgi:hypothetical protein
MNSRGYTNVPVVGRRYRRQNDNTTYILLDWHMIREYGQKKDLGFRLDLKQLAPYPSTASEYIGVKQFVQSFVMLSDDDV